MSSPSVAAAKDSQKGHGSSAKRKQIPQSTTESGASGSNDDLTTGLADQISGRLDSGREPKRMRVTWRSNLDGEDTDQFDPMDPNYWGYKPLLPSKGGKDEDTQQLTPADALTRASRMAVHLTGLNKSGRKIVLGTLAGMDTTIVVSATAAMMLRTERVAGEKPQKQGSVAEKASNVRNEVKGKKPGDGSPYASMPNFETLRGAVNTASTELRGYRPGAEGRNEIVAKVNEAQKAFRAAKVAWAATTEGKEILASFEAKSKNK